ncbi:MAG TPA: hypothetical protein DEA43_04770 [Candidatus Moranbacteria bacterium]|nr:hypothetical protein [Candidatus Moranbacteria bacterium]HBT46167.1 hypothetical protein [Candidatus Moranbacteria bacterium]
MPLSLGNKNLRLSRQNLHTMFAEKHVAITHDHESSLRNLKNAHGVCVAVNEDGASLEVVLADKSRWGIVPDDISHNSIEGRISLSFPGRRTIRIV